MNAQTHSENERFLATWYDVYKSKAKQSWDIQQAFLVSDAFCKRAPSQIREYTHAPWKCFRQRFALYMAWLAREYRGEYSVLKTMHPFGWVMWAVVLTKDKQMMSRDELYYHVHGCTREEHDSEHFQYQKYDRKRNIY